MGIFGSLLQAIPAIKTGLNGRNLKQQKQTAYEMGQLGNAQYNPNSPIFQNLYNSNREAGNQDLAATIGEISRQNRKQVSMGRTPLLDQERGGESVFRNLIQGQQGIQNQARQDTFGQLRNAQAAKGGVYNTQDSLSQNSYSNDLTKVGAYYSIGDLLKNLFSLNRQPETINWRS